MHERCIAVVDDPTFDAHRPRGQHPERPERLEAARSGLDAALPASARHALPASEANDEALCRVHAPAYVRALRDALGRGSGHLDPDTYFSEGSAEAAWRAAGGAAALAQHLLEPAHGAGIALLRPPGHHARPSASMGFCMLNNVAVAAAEALAQGAERVAIVDWDVHHGNGTQEAFYEDPRVLFVSTHQFPFYPGTGSAAEVGVGAGAGFTANIPMPAGVGPAAYGEAFRALVLPLLEAYAPELLLVSAGFDAHERDPLAGLSLDADTFGAMTTALRRHAETHDIGLGLLLEGGYDLDALEASVAASARALRGEVTELPEDEPSAGAKAAIDATRVALSPHWTLA